MEHTSSKPSRSNKLSRTSRAALVAGLAAGASFGAATGIAAATSGPPATPAGPGPAGAPPGPLGMRAHGPRGPGGPGGGGTITAIDGTTLTLRTENGVETVDTSSSTTFSKERQTIALSDLRVNDVVHVGAVAAPGAAPAAAPVEPGTGTVSARAVIVVEPTLAGRVASIGTGTYTLVGRDGQLLTVATTGSTRYYRGASQTSASAVTVGSRVMAEGTRTGLTQLTADVITIGPAPGVHPAGGAGIMAPPVAR